jgi:iron complex transport system ATP-binding protein
MTAALLSISDVSLACSGSPLLVDISLSITLGEKVAVVGPNGAGKSSLLKMIAGLYGSYLGAATIEGLEIRGLSPKKLSRIVSLVPQRLEFIPRFTVEEFFDLSGLVDLSHSDPTLVRLLNRYLPDLSGGELQRVILAGAVAQGARLLLLDEPTAHLDPTGRAGVERVISRYHAEKKISYLLVTHDVTLAVRAAERILVMKEGRVVWDGSTADPHLAEVLSRAYECGFTRVQHPATGESLLIPEAAVP